MRVVMRIVVFGGTGFLGRRVAERLLRAGHDVRVASRHPETAEHGDAVYADVRDEASVADALAGTDGAVNAVSLYVERGGVSFEDIHVDGARRVARRAAAGGLRLVHVSGIGADARSDSAYVRARGRGETAVRGALAATTLLRPSAMFGDGDGLLASLDAVTRLPVVPLFGRGDTRLQPVYAGEVATAAVRALEAPAAAGRTYELGGPEVFTYRGLLERLLAHAGRRRVLLPVPFALWHGGARVLGLLPSPPLTIDQVILMQRDNVAAEGLPGLADLGIVPTPVEAKLPG
jgi:uncharacterized protein YbjT (DUF2867 family)